MKWTELNKPPVIETTGCVRCDGLRKATQNKVRFCLRHDPTLSEEWRRQVHIPLEPLPEKKENHHAEDK